MRHFVDMSILFIAYETYKFEHICGLEKNLLLTFFPEDWAELAVMNWFM